MATAQERRQWLERDDSSPEVTEASSWPQLDEAAFHGLAGQVVGVLEPDTEAAPAGLLLTFLTCFGSAAGAGSYAVADAAQHPARLYTVLVGKTARSRKGTSWRQVAEVMQHADPCWHQQRVFGGLASGEGLIAAVSDDEESERTDKRLLVHEPEFARVLKVASREGSTLSEILRDLWDRGEARVMTRKDPLRADAAHVSLVGHVTLEELRKVLYETEVMNGLGNRHLFACVHRSKRLPNGGSLSPGTYEELGASVGEVLGGISRFGRLSRTPEAEELWREIYLGIDDEVGGMLGAATARAEAQMLRLSVVYALLDRSRVIDVPHLEAARAVWRFCEESAAYIFGEKLGDDVADRLYEALVAAGEVGLDGTQQRDVFSRHVSAERLSRARQLLEGRGLIETVEEPTGGRPRLLSYARKAWQASKEGTDGGFPRPERFPRNDREGMR